METIPKVIHYCWFGGKPHPPAMVKCMDGWRRILPDYRIIEWNETNIDVASVDYMREAYEAQKFAFVSDYARLWALFHHGGIYMDTDVEVLKPLDDFLAHEAFSGFEDEARITTAIMGSRRGGEWVGRLLADYEGLHFLMADGSFDETTNVARITQTTEKAYGIVLDNTRQDVPGVLSLYPRDYFCPKSYVTGIISRTPRTHVIHHFTGSWKPQERRASRSLRGRLNRTFGVRIGGWLYAVRVVQRDEGFGSLMHRAMRAGRTGLDRILARGGSRS